MRNFLNRLLRPYRLRLVRLNGRITELQPILRAYSAKLQKRFAKSHGLVVSRGPFKDLFFRRDAKKLLGTYEHELHDSIEELISFEPLAVLNIGSADGYYALGLAKRLKQAQIYAYDLDERYGEIISDLATKNGVTVQFLPRAFDRNDLAFVQGLKTAVVLDVEGAEKDVLVEFGDALKDMFLIIETHDIFVPNITEAIVGLLKETHEITEIEELPKQTNLPALSSFSCLDRALLVNEFRAGKQVWLIASPRA